MRNLKMFQSNHTRGVEHGSTASYRRTSSEASQKSPPRMPATIIPVALSSSDVLYGTVTACGVDIPEHIEIPVCSWLQKWRLPDERQLIPTVTHRWFHTMSNHSQCWLDLYFFLRVIKKKKKPHSFDTKIFLLEYGVFCSLSCLHFSHWFNCWDIENLLNPPSLFIS